MQQLLDIGFDAPQATSGEQGDVQPDGLNCNQLGQFTTEEAPRRESLQAESLNYVGERSHSRAGDLFGS